MDIVFGRQVLLVKATSYPNIRLIGVVPHAVSYTHQMCIRDRSGIIVERGTTADLFATPHKEWTKEFVRLAMAEEGGGWTWQKSKSEM